MGFLKNMSAIMPVCLDRSYALSLNVRDPAFPWGLCQQECYPRCSIAEFWTRAVGQNRSFLYYKVDQTQYHVIGNRK